MMTPLYIDKNQYSIVSIYWQAISVYVNIKL
jgi:hypothetical protein